MSKFAPLDENQGKLLLEDLWEIKYDCSKWFPQEIYKWIQHDATILGVPEVYLALPIIVAVGHLSQHSKVVVNEYHREPMIIYGIVAGRSGTNKSASLALIADIVEEIKPNSIFDSGTIDGLAKSLESNKGCVVSINDEFANFIENLDSGNKKNSEKSRILTLYNGNSWSKRTKTCGSFNIEDPRFNIVRFTQPDYLFDFARNPGNLRDGFFQMFFVCVPDEVYVTRQQTKDALLNKNDDGVAINDVLKRISVRCEKKEITMNMEYDAELMYDELSDGVVEFRKKDKFDNHKVSVKSKSKGLSLRLAGVVSLLRNAVKEDQSDDKMDAMITASDFGMALEMIEYSVSTAFKFIHQI